MAIYKKGKAVRLSKNFKSTELDCNGVNCCKNTLIDKELVKALQKIRDYFNKPVVINSGYRCTIHNKAVNGVNNSKHLQGMAADIVVKGVEPRVVAAYAERIGIKGIGLYSSFVHIDTRKNKSYWQGQAQLKLSTFGTKTNRKIAEEVIAGYWGTGAARKRKLTAAGYDAKEIQLLVNELLRK